MNLGKITWLLLSLSWKADCTSKKMREENAWWIGNQQCLLKSHASPHCELFKVLGQVIHYSCFQKSNLFSAGTTSKIPLCGTLQKEYLIGDRESRLVIGVYTVVGIRGEVQLAVHLEIIPFLQYVWVIWVTFVTVPTDRKARLLTNTTAIWQNWNYSGGGEYTP